MMGYFTIFHCVQIGSGVHPASSPIRTGKDKVAPALLTEHDAMKAY
jgi:hypothetical protein